MNTGLLILALLLILAGISYYDNHRFLLNTYEIKDKSIQKKQKIVLLADLHEHQYGFQNEHLLKCIREENPDFCVIAGDMITAKESLNHESVYAFLRKLTLEYPVYYAFGNHESKVNRWYEANKKEEYHIFEKLKSIGVHLLLNESVSIPESGIEVIGLHLGKQYFPKGKKVTLESLYLKTLLPETDKNKYRILVAHNPQYYDAYDEWGANLVLSGHVHGGTIRFFRKWALISPSFHLFPKFHGGMYQKNNSKMIVSRGLGMHTIPLRINNPGELTVISLEPEKS